MGKAARLRKNSATKLSIKDFHASLVKGKLANSGSFHVHLNLSDLQDEEYGDCNVYEKNLYYNTPESQDSIAYSSGRKKLLLLKVDIENIKMQQHSLKPEEAEQLWFVDKEHGEAATPEAMIEVTDRQRTLEADSNLMEMPPFQQAVCTRHPDKLESSEGNEQQSVEQKPNLNEVVSMEVEKKDDSDGSEQQSSILPSSRAEPTLAGSTILVGSPMMCAGKKDDSRKGTTAMLDGNGGASLSIRSF